MTRKFNKRNIVREVCDKTKLSEQGVSEIVGLTLDAIGEALSNGDSVTLRTFGAFEVQTQRSRIGRNPKRPETDIAIPSRAVIKFKPGKELKARMKSLDPNGIE